MSAVAFTSALMALVTLGALGAAGARALASTAPSNGLITFTSTRDGNQEIYVMNADGSGTATNLTDDAAEDFSGRWSPDRAKVGTAWSPKGNDLAFGGNASQPATDDDIYVAHKDGSGLIRLTNTPDPEGVGSWSPDGTTILYDRCANLGTPQQQCGLFTVRAGGGPSTQLTFGAYDVGGDWG